MKNGGVDGKTIDLQKRVKDLEEALDAIHRGEVDVIMGPDYPLAIVAQLVRDQLETAAREWQTTFDAIPDGICILDGEQRVIRGNKYLARLCSHGMETMVGKRCWEVIHGRSCPLENCIFRQFRADRRPHQIEIEQEGRWLELALYPVEASSQDRREERYVHIVRDITDRKLVEQRVRETEAQLRQAQKMETVARLAGGIAHDFNNMLNVILGYADLVKGQLSSNDPMLEDIEEISRAASKSASLTRQLLAFSRQQPISPKYLDINEVIRNSLKMLGRLIGEDIKIEFRPGEEVGQILMDPSQLDQILANLSVNARDAIPTTGVIRMETRACMIEAGDQAAETLDPGPYVCLSFADTGVGIASEIQEKIFEPFFTTKKEGEGTGLGLSTIYGIMNQNGGLITVRSIPGTGTTFELYFPQHEGREEKEDTGQLPDLLKGSETVLVVDDEVQVTSLCKRILERAGYTVLLANSPREALLWVNDRGEEIDLLVTDVVMPGMDGRELQSRIEAHCPAIRTLFMSGYLPEKLQKVGGGIERSRFFLPKPFDRHDLLVKVRQVLDAG